MFIPIIYSEGSTIYEKWGEIKICIMSNECDTSKSNVKEGERIFFDVLPMLLAAGLLFAVSGRFLIADPNTRKAMANWTPHLQRAVRYVFFGLILVLISNLFDLDTMMTDSITYHYHIGIYFKILLYGAMVVAGNMDIRGAAATPAGFASSPAAVAVSPVQNASAVCPSCKGANTAEARFCKHCGSVLALACPGCHQPVNPDARFCPQCGAEIPKN